jgi:hypothetical protein
MQKIRLFKGQRGVKKFFRHAFPLFRRQYPYAVVVPLGKNKHISGEFLPQPGGKTYPAFFVKGIFKFAGQQFQKKEFPLSPTIPHDFPKNRYKPLFPYKKYHVNGLFQKKL